MKERIIIGLKEKMLPIILKECNEAEKLELEASYNQYLEVVYSDLNTYEGQITEDELKQIVIESEIEKWNSKSVVERQALLVKDEFMEKLVYLSNIGLKNATIRLGNEIKNTNFPVSISKEEADKNISLMKEYAQMVKPYNKAEASMILSEGKLDYMYAVGLTSYTSLRIGRMR